MSSESVVVPVEVHLDGATRNPSAPQAQLSPTELVQQLTRQIGAAYRAQTAFQEGRVYCYYCDNSDCGHSAPSNRAQTFMGYSANGKPTWQSLTNLLIERQDPRVERLFGSEPELVVIKQTSASGLVDDLLPGFARGNHGWRLIGQITAGMVARDLRMTRDGERIALTLQVVETRCGREGRRLRLNVIGSSTEEIATIAADGDAHTPAERLRRLLWATRQRLGAIGKRANEVERRGGGVSLDEAARPVIDRLASDVSRVLKPARRRTQHAEERHRSGERPTRTAIQDAIQASDHDVLLDTRRDTFVVLGPKSRAHIFTEQGKHVTSIQLAPGEVTRKMGRDRWRKLPRDEVAAFRGRVAAPRR